MTWLHRIATNVCLTALEGRARRPLPSGLGAAGDPAGAVQQRAALRLAFVAALQLLPARQRAALVLREVLQLTAAEVAEALDSSVASVNSSLQRARAALAAAGPVLDEVREPADPGERAAVERYAAAFEAADVPALTRLLADDVAHSLQVFAVRAGLVRRCVTFADPGLFPAFGLPPRLS
ncbi:hypothetical protein Ade02nite_58120 [Paractinoplanes deccanensis]|uniref:RNA polymerase sigma factor 70 region 4 type 2 domain-containing protein n=1 Tax=Paractinoplanes deccanensis TaxID=113561 RepID=A0ABQ3YB33_9ACTN|nr:sigma factor-like helix-turn-helix DNA-binding protein [Actinoplanes deccanensis]GID77171.1 hypothetical protein Ade02nite_58120 [Actinoplanes deccanensis]